MRHIMGYTTQIANALKFQKWDGVEKVSAQNEDQWAGSA